MRSFAGTIDMRTDGPSAPGDRAGHNLLLWMVDAALAGVLLVAPLFMGGRHPLGEFVFVLLAVIAASAWLLRQCRMSESAIWTWSKAEWVLLLGAALLVVQIVPLPEPLLQYLSPRSSQILPLWNADADAPLALGSWQQISLTPYVTRGSLVLYLAYCLLFLVAVQRLQRLEDVEKLLRCLSVAAVLLAAVGLLQYLAGNGKFLWIYEHPYRGTSEAVKGPLINKNHFAHLMALGLAPLLWIVQDALARQSSTSTAAFDQRRSTLDQLRLMGALIALALVLFAGLMTLSRGGAVAMLVAALVSIGAFARRSLIDKKFVVLTAGLFLVVGAALLIHGLDRVSDRLDDYASGSLDELDRKAGRRTIWAADSHAVRDFWRLGTGAGSHRDVYPMYFSGSFDVEMTHAENGYLQVAMETGLPGLILLLVGLAVCVRWCAVALRSTGSGRTFACAAVVTAGLAASALHSVIDFVWYIPACMSFAVVLAACGCRLAQLRQAAVPPRKRLSPKWSYAALSVVALVGSWMVTHALCAAMASPHWDRYLAYSLHGAAQDEDGSAHAAALVDLNEIVGWTPDDPRAHVRLAGVCLRRFDQLQRKSPNAMALTQIRDAALASRFGSRAALDTWLERAVGEPRAYLDKALWHVRRGLALCPLQGEAYLYLGELCFLEGLGDEAKAALVSQALTVRPSSPRVLLAAGNEAALAGKMEEAVRHWKRAFHGGTEERRQLVRVLVANRVPVDFALTSFDPDLAGLRELYDQYVPVAPPETLGPLLDRYAQAAEADASRIGNESAAAMWVVARQIHIKRGDTLRAQLCLQHALTADPANYEVHYLLGLQLSEAGRMEEAEQHLTWCQMRKPSDVRLAQKLEAVTKARISR